MIRAQHGDSVKVSYTGRLRDGTVVGASPADVPVHFTIGSGEVITGFEEAVIGMAPGERKTVVIQAEKAYGPHQEDRLCQVERSAFPADEPPEVGGRVRIRQGETEYWGTVREISGNRVTLDVNHPLAGRDVVFDIRLVEVD